jgi:hypothetical protein
MMKNTTENGQLTEEFEQIKNKMEHQIYLDLIKLFKSLDSPCAHLICDSVAAAVRDALITGNISYISINYGTV